jgi:hypothetical protein
MFLTHRPNLLPRFCFRPGQCSPLFMCLADLHRQIAFDQLIVQSCELLELVHRSAEHGVLLVTPSVPAASAAFASAISHPTLGQLKSSARPMRALRPPPWTMTRSAAQSAGDSPSCPSPSSCSELSEGIGVNGKAVASEGSAICEVVSGAGGFGDVLSSTSVASSGSLRASFRDLDDLRCGPVVARSRCTCTIK